MRRSAWPNVPSDELVRLVDDWAAREAANEERYWLVTSDRGLRKRAAPRAERVIGGGSFLRALRGVE